MAVEASLSLGNVPVKLRWEEPFASSGADHKTQGVIPKGIYRGFAPVAQVGTFLLDLIPDANTGDSVAVFEATAQTLADGGVPAFNPTAGFNLTVFESATVTIDLTTVAQGASRLVVFRVQYDEGNNFPTQALVRAIPVADLQPTDVIIAEFTIPPASLNLNTTVFTPGEDARTLQMPFVTVGDGFESRGDFTGNRPNAAGTDTSSVIQAAVNALHARSIILGLTTKGIVFVKRGDYTISSTIPMRATMALVGEDQNLVLLRQSAPAVRIFDFDAADPTKSQLVRVEQVDLIGDGAATDPVVRMNDATNIIVRDVTVDYFVAVVPIQILGASQDCVVRNVRRLSAPLLADTVLLDGTATRCRVEGTPVNIRQTGTTTQNEVTTSRVTHPGATAIDGTVLTDLRAAVGAVRDLRFGAVTQYMRGYIRGLDIRAIPDPGVGASVLATDGVIEIDGMLFESLVTTNITASVAVAANIYSYVYARRNTATGALEFVGLAGNANHPVYSPAQNAWVRSGTGTGGVPTQRYIGCLLSLAAVVGSYQPTEKIGDEVYLDGSYGTVGTVNPVSVILPVISSGTPTTSAFLTLPGLPLIDSSRGGAIVAPPIVVAGGLASLLDVEVDVAYAGGGTNNKTCLVTLRGQNDQRTSLSDDFIKLAAPGSPTPLVHRFPAVRTLVAVLDNGTGIFFALPRISVQATVAGLGGGDTATVTVTARQRSFTDVR